MDRWLRNALATSTRARSAGISERNPVTTLPTSTPFSWLIEISTGKWPCIVTNLTMGTFAFAMMVTLSVILARLSVLASACKTVIRSEYAMDGEMTTKSMSLQRGQIVQRSAQRYPTLTLTEGKAW